MKKVFYRKKVIIIASILLLACIALAIVCSILLNTSLDFLIVLAFDVSTMIIIVVCCSERLIFTDTGLYWCSFLYRDSPLTYSKITKIKVFRKREPVFRTKIILEEPRYGDFSSRYSKRIELTLNNNKVKRIQISLFFKKQRSEMLSILKEKCENLDFDALSTEN